MRRWLFAAALAPAIALAACITWPRHYLVGQAPIPVEYAAWKAEVEACSGVHKDGFPVVYILPDPFVPPAWQAYYLSRQHFIVIREGNEWKAEVVRHELLHWLVNAPGDTSHPAEFFEHRCKGLV